MTRPKARRQLRRAARLAHDSRYPEAVVLATSACEHLRRHARDQGRGEAEYLAALATLSDLLLARMDLGAALVVTDELVTLTEAARGHHADRYDHADRVADALVRRGNIRRLRGEYDPARTDLDRALRLAQTPLQQAGAHNAAGILAKDAGRLAEAHAHYQRAFARMEAEIGVDRPELASLFHNLAGLEHASGDYVAGEPHARRAIALRTAAFGHDSPAVAADLAVLGALLTGQGRLDQAEELFNQTLATWLRAHGPDHYEVAISLESLAWLHAKQGATERSSQEHLEALRIKEAVLGPDHPEVRGLRATHEQLLRSTH
jgi:tetratricopeptide (TPR) repeat protein